MDTVIRCNTPKARTVRTGTDICLAVDKMLRKELRYILGTATEPAICTTEIDTTTLSIVQVDSSMFTVILHVRYTAPLLNMGRSRNAGAYILHVTSGWNTCAMVSTYLRKHVIGNMNDAVASLAATKAVKDAKEREYTKKKAFKAAERQVYRARKAAALAAQRTPAKLREARQAKNRLTARLAREKREEARNAVVVLAAKEKERDA